MERGPKRVERKLAAILAADVAGYSSLVEKDEIGTLRSLQAHREILDRLIAEHGGRIANTAGDSVLAEFLSAVDAVQCAVEIQRHLSADLREPKLHFRMGVHVGDVVVHGGDLLGDGVNIAARLQELAEPEGIYVSAQAHDYVRKALPLRFEDLGQRPLKNMAEPVRVFAVRNRARDLRVEEAEPFILPDRPSIAVLPFVAAGETEEAFSDGVADDIITALSRFRSLLVVARNSSFTYKGTNVSVKAVAHELGVRYILGGSVRKAGGRLRITAQLMDARSGANLWADRFDGEVEDIFDLQDQVTERVVGAIAPHIEQAEIEQARRKQEPALNAYECYLRGLYHLHSVTREDNNEALRLFRRSIELDPASAYGYAGAAICYAHRALNGWMEDVTKESNQAVELARTAARIGGDDSRSLERAANVLLFVAYDVEAAAGLVDRALSINPNSAGAWLLKAFTAMFAGDPELALDAVDRCCRLSPIDPMMGTFQTARAHAYFYLGRYEEAYQTACRSVQHKPMLDMFPVLAASAVMSGRLDEARAAVQQILQRAPDTRLSNVRIRRVIRQPEVLDTALRALRLAGLPE